jgi:hypothetical protein
MRQALLSKQAVLDTLQEGPITAAEMGAVLEKPMRNCSAWLGNLRCAGIVKVIGKRPVGNRHSNLYALSDWNGGAA